MQECCEMTVDGSLSVPTNVKPVVEIQHPVQRIKPKPLAPQGNPLGVVNAGLSRNPTSNFLVARTCRDELFEFSGVNAGEVEKPAVKWTVVMIGSSAAGEFSPAFVERPRSNNAVGSERSPSAARSNSCQVPSQCQNSFVSHSSSISDLLKFGQRIAGRTFFHVDRVSRGGHAVEFLALHKRWPDLANPGVVAVDPAWLVRVTCFSGWKLWPRD